MLNLDTYDRLTGGEVCCGCACDRRPGDPTPEQIAAACEQIRAGWTDRELQSRAEVRDARGLAPSR